MNQVHAARQSLRVHGYMRDSSVIHSGAHGAALDRVLLGRAAVSDDAGALHNRKRGRDAIFEFWKLKKNQFSKWRCHLSEPQCDTLVWPNVTNHIFFGLVWQSDYYLCSLSDGQHSFCFVITKSQKNNRWRNFSNSISISFLVRKRFLE